MPEDELMLLLVGENVVFVDKSFPLRVFSRSSTDFWVNQIYLHIYWYTIEQNRPELRRCLVLFEATRPWIQLTRTCSSFVS